MEDKRLERVFDQVRLSPEREKAMLADLLTEQKEDSSMKQTNNRRRIPAAALAAAVLAVVLAGSALAVEYLGKVNVTRAGDGYSLEANVKNIPLSSLSAEVLERGKAVSGPTEVIPFDSWEEAEAFLGLEIADNAKLDQMEKGQRGISLGQSDETVVAPCLIMLHYQNSLPYEIDLNTNYREGEFSVSEKIVLMLEDPTWEGERSYNLINPLTKTGSVETYVTPSGMEVTIMENHTSFRADWTVTTFDAEFILNGAVFTVSTGVNEGETCESALAALKEVLDAYE